MPSQATPQAIPSYTLHLNLQALHPHLNPTPYTLSKPSTPYTLPVRNPDLRDLCPHRQLHF